MHSLQEQVMHSEGLAEASILWLTPGTLDVESKVKSVKVKDIMTLVGQVEQCIASLLGRGKSPN